jgi:hypothetical protein
MKKEPKEHEYEVEIFVDGMEYPEVATLTIVARNGREAMTWVKDHLRLSAEKI